MRQCIGGNGADTTAAVQTYLRGTDHPLIRYIILIGEQEDPRSIFLTTHEAPVLYPPWGTFQPAVVNVGSVTAKVGLEVQKIALKWTPGNLNYTASAATASPLQLARLHFYDNWPVRIFKVFMPTPGDASTLGACAWFGGRIGATSVGRNEIEFTVNSFLDVVTQKLPANVIESTSTLAGFTAASLVAGETSQPTFQVFAGTTTNSIIADCLSPTANKIYSGNLFVAGYMVFLPGAGATLAGFWSAIGGNGAYIDGNGNHHSIFSIYTAMPWAPTPVVDQFYVSPAAPINSADGDFFGFPYTPQPTVAV